MKGEGREGKKKRREGKGREGEEKRREEKRNGLRN